MSENSNVFSVDIEKRFSGVSIKAAFSQDASRYSSTALFGPSGCGKTTILRSIAGLERPEEGSVSWNGERWFDAAAKVFVPPQERRVGLLFQDYALFPFLSVEDNIAYGLPKSCRKDVGPLMERFRISGLEKRLPRQLSGGQQQRVALARAVFHKPRLLLLDEPLSALDMPTRNLLRLELRRLLRDAGVPSVIVTHDPVEAMALADRIVVLDHGRVLQQGPVDEVFSRPASLEVARIVGMETVAHGQVEGSSSGLLALKVGSATVYAPEPPGGVHGAVDICIRAEDVIVQTGDAEIPSSVRNRLKGRVVNMASEGPLVRLSIDCGFALTALVTKQSAMELGLAEGVPVTALVKAVAVHLIPRNGN
jgi:molybdate transport system ATP-binding protein